MVFVDWYVVLAIEPTADAAVVRRAYRRAALKYHPDKNPDVAAADQFDLLGQALAVLTDDARRAEFDAERARRAARAARDASQTERVRELKAKLDAAELRESREPAIAPPDLEALRQESYEHRRALDALRGEQLLGNAREAPEGSDACRTLADGSRTFSTVAEARAFVDSHPGTRLQASWRPAEYSKEYEQATLDRLSSILESRLASQETR